MKRRSSESPRSAQPDTPKRHSIIAPVGVWGSSKDDFQCVEIIYNAEHYRMMRLDALSAVKYRNTEENIFISVSAREERASSKLTLGKDGIPDLQSVKHELCLDKYMMDDEGHFTYIKEDLKALTKSELCRNWNAALLDCFGDTLAKKALYCLFKSITGLVQDKLPANNPINIINTASSKSINYLCVLISTRLQGDVLSWSSSSPSPPGVDYKPPMCQVTESPSTLQLRNSKTTEKPEPAGHSPVSHGRIRLSDVIVYTRDCELKPINTIFEVSIKKGDRKDLFNLFENMLGRLPYQSTVYGIHINLHTASIWRLSKCGPGCKIELLSRNDFVGEVIQEDSDGMTKKYIFHKDQVYQFIDNAAQVLIHKANQSV